MFEPIGNKVGEGFNRISTLIKNKMLNKSNSDCNHKEISPGDHDHDSKEEAKFPGMKKYS
jgi:hypothetical protein